MQVDLTEIIGYIGSLCFAICGLPQAIKSWKDGNSEGLTVSFLVLWLLGEVFTIWYVLDTNKEIPLLMNYSFNILLLLIIGKYKIWPRKHVCR